MALYRHPINCGKCGHTNGFVYNPMSEQQRISGWVGDNGGKYPEYCEKCGEWLHKLSIAPSDLSTEIINQLNGETPSVQDKSVMVKLTPEEILNLVKMGANYWHNATEHKTTLSMEEVCKFHFDIAMDILKATDPDRFIYNS